MRVRKINRQPEGRNYFVLDSSFLVNRYIPENRAPAGKDRRRIELCNLWWDEIEAQLDAAKARVYIPDICIAESFKTLAKKYYTEGWFRSSADHAYYRRKMRKAITTPPDTLRRKGREIRYHDVETNRDIIIAVDRFYEIFHTHSLHKVSLADLLIVSTAKYLMDFFDIPRDLLHIVTLDGSLRNGSTKIQELPNAYNPTRKEDHRDRVFQ